VNSRAIAIIGGLLALWMSAGRWVFGIGGSLTWWYVPTIGLLYAGLCIWIAARVRITRERGRRTGRSTIVSLVLSWVCAVGFGFAVPDRTEDGLASIIGHLAGSAFGDEMAIALCNPLGIVAFTLAIFALAFAHVDARDPKPEIEEYEGEGQVPTHPLA